MNYYPESPKNVPPGLTKPGRRFKKQVLLVFASLILFMMLYLLVVAFSGYLVYLTIFEVPISIGKYGFMFKFGLIITSVFIFVSVVRTLFKRIETVKPEFVEIRRRDHPQLFEFIRNICLETKAPMPHKIYVSYFVNAAVFIDSSSMARLFAPPKKNLLIGLGLVNGLNLSEFKAILAHEFGHISQSSMKLGSYVYTAEQIVSGLISDPGGIDSALDNAIRMGSPLSVIAWLVRSVIRILRWPLKMNFIFLNRTYASLRREMEFHADRVSVSVAGSDAIIHAMWKAEYLEAVQLKTWSLLSVARDHKIASSDIFSHDHVVRQFLKRMKKNPEWGDLKSVPSQNSEKHRLFSAANEFIPDMYASHPPSWMREENAKKDYVQAINDERPAWSLFDREKLAPLVSATFYKENFGISIKRFSSVEKVGEFIRSELNDFRFSPSYCDYYTYQYITCFNYLEVKDRIVSDEEIEEKAVFTESLGSRVVRDHENEIKIMELESFLKDEAASQAIFDGKKIGKNAAEHTRNILMEENSKLQKGFAEHDEWIFLKHYRATADDPPSREKLLKIYELNDELNNFRVRLADVGNRFDSYLRAVVPLPEESAEAIRSFKARCWNFQLEVSHIYEAVMRFELPEESGMTQDEMQSFLSESFVLPAKVTVSNEYISEIFTLINQLGMKIQRLRDKHLKAMITIQESIIPVSDEGIVTNENIRKSTHVT